MSYKTDFTILHNLLSSDAILINFNSDAIHIHLQEDKIIHTFFVKQKHLKQMFHYSHKLKTSKNKALK